MGLLEGEIKLRYIPYTRTKQGSNCTLGDGPRGDTKKKTGGGGSRDGNATSLGARVKLRGGFKKEGNTFTGLNHGGGVSVKKRPGTTIKSKLDPIVTEMTKGDIVCHFGVENTLNCSVKRKVEPELKERIASMSRDKLKITVNCPIEEAMTASSAVSSSNDTLILLNKKNELSGRQSSETFTGANGRLTMQFSNVDKQISALICLYGVTDTCGSLTADEKADLTEKDVALEAKNRRKMRADAKRHLEADLRTYVGLAKDCGATIVFSFFLDNKALSLSRK